MVIMSTGLRQPEEKSWTGLPFDKCDKVVELCIASSLTKTEQHALESRKQNPAISSNHGNIFIVSGVSLIS